MEYEKISKMANKYILVMHLVIAVIFNVILIIVTLVLQDYIPNKFTITINYLGISIIIFSYMWAFLRTNSIILNYKFRISDEFVEVIHGAVVVSRKMMKIDKIIKIETKRGIIGRIFKVACIKFSSNGSSIKICYIDYETIDKVESVVKKKIVRDRNV